MRALLTISLAAALLGGCRNTDGRLKDVSWGKPVEGHYDVVLERTLFVLNREFPRGFDPDKSNEDDGDFWTVWHHERGTFNFKTTRSRARVVVEDLGDGKCRVGVAVVKQLNNNIENPSVIDEARWVKTHRDEERESRIERGIARRYLALQPSEYWKEKHRAVKRNTLREDLIDKYKDVNLGEPTIDIDDEARQTPTVTGPHAGHDREGHQIDDPFKKKKKDEEEDKK